MTGLETLDWHLRAHERLSLPKCQVPTISLRKHEYPGVTIFIYCLVSEQ